MENPIDLPDVAGRKVTGWRVDEGHLDVTIDGAERSLRCVCTRCHWIVETAPREGQTVLVLRCHGCGRRSEIVLAMASA